MYKLKSIKSVSKRFKMTAKGKLLRNKASRSHLLQKKRSKRKRHLRRKARVSSFDNIYFQLKIS